MSWFDVLKMKFNVPSRKIEFDNEGELKEVRKAVKEARLSEGDLKRFDDSAIKAVADIVGEDDDDYDDLSNDIREYVKKEKEKHNRKRPFEVDPSVRNVKFKTTTMDTPSYPSGHALAGYVMAHVMADKYPEKRRELFSTADDVAHSRMQMGAHYPTDLKESERLSKLIFEKHLKD